MRFSPTTIEGVTLIELEPAEDTRGFFARTFCEEEADRAGIALRAQQINLSHNRDAFTLRGMHYQAAPHREAKIVQCVRGRAYDVALDLRPESATYRRWIGFELSPDQPRSLFIPEGCAHGFLTLEADTDLLYLMGTAYVAGAARGVRWNDSAFAIQWPAEPRVISERDASFPDFEGS
jgi:dTDP-4-dehydrorhamnose 3,5-epimerase